MGKVIEFPPQNVKPTATVPELTLSHAPSVEYANDQPPPDVIEELNKAFGPDDFAFGWLVVDGRGFRLSDEAFAMPSAQDGYNVVG